MGMYDYVYCEYPLPQPESTVLHFSSGHDFQTKDLDNCLFDFKITIGGRLLYRSSQNVNWTEYKLPNGKPYFGAINFYDSLEESTNKENVFKSIWVDYVALFSKGKVIEIDIIQERVSYYEEVKSPLLGCKAMKAYIPADDEEL